jgi:hypothetical protein
MAKRGSLSGCNIDADTSLYSAKTKEIANSREEIHQQAKEGQGNWKNARKL